MPEYYHMTSMYPDFSSCAQNVFHKVSFKLGFLSRTNNAIDYLLSPSFYKKQPFHFLHDIGFLKVNFLIKCVIVWIRTVVSSWSHLTQMWRGGG